MDNNLIVCVTPLQILIAEKIMDIHPGSYTAIIIHYDRNEKYEYYINRIKSKSKYFISCHISGNSKVSRFFEMIRFRFKVNKINERKYEYCFVASIENPFVLSILSSTVFEDIRTFDDGTANINLDSIYYRDLGISRVEQCIRRFLSINLTRDDIKKMSSLHYTLFPNLTNIIPNRESINLIDNIGNEMKSPIGLDLVVDKAIDIFIGQPLYSIDKQFNNKFIESIIDKYNIKYYYPHPRERFIISGVDYINSKLIFEDFILSLIRDRKDINVRLYTFFSTAALNVLNIPHIQIYSFRNESLYEKYKSTYNLFEKIGDIHFIDL